MFGLITLLESYKRDVPMMNTAKFLFLYWMLERDGTKALFNRVVKPLIRTAVVVNVESRMPGAFIKTSHFDSFKVDLEEPVDLAPCAV